MLRILKRIYHKLGILLYRHDLDRDVVTLIDSLGCKVNEKKHILRYLSVIKNKGAEFDVSNQRARLIFDGTTLCGPILDTSFLDVIVEFEKDEYELNIYDLKNKVVLDIGANIGDSAVKFFKKGAKKVISLEPNKNLEQYFIQNMLLNGFKNYDYYSFGLSGKTETLSVPYRPWASAGTTTLNKLNWQHKNKWPEIKLDLLSFDIFTDKYLSNDQIDVIKLDCEGSEYDILQNDAFFDLKPSLIFVEYHLGLQNLETILQEKGYRTSVKQKTDTVGLIFAESLHYT
jgi:FkbM family methyltransferase